MTNATRLDAGTIDGMLSGRMEPDDAPARFAAVAELARALTAPPTARELVGEAAAVAAASAILMTPPPPRDLPDRRGATASPAKVLLRRTKVMSLVFAGTLLATTGLAVAGVLPDPIQDVAHRILSTVGIDVPSSDGDRPSDPGGGERSPAPAVVDDQNVQDPDDGSAPPEDAADEDSDEHGQSDDPHGQNDEPHGQNAEPHGQNAEPHGQNDEPHGQNDDPHGQNDEPHGQNDEPHGNGNGNGNV